eukprot:3936769-Prymnesium_polylepis.1
MDDRLSCPSEKDREGKGPPLWAKLADSNRRDSHTLKYFSEEQLGQLLDYLLDNAFVTFGDAVYRQQLGVPIGFGAASIVANFALAWRELQGIEHMVQLTALSAGRDVRMPAGVVQMTEEIRIRLAELAAKLVRCCRNIDDVLFIDLSKDEA